MVHESAHLHVTGKAQYIDDINLPANALCGVALYSPIAHGIIKNLNYDEALQMPGVVTIIDYNHIPGHNQMGAVTKDEPVLAEKQIEFMGQAICLVAAKTRQQGIDAVRKIILEIEEQSPVLTIEDSMNLGWKLQPTTTMEMGNIDEAFKNCPNILEDTIISGAQEHWYLETQAAIAIPGEQYDIKILSSTQHPSEVQALVADVLKLQKHQVEIETRRLGGGFGGKETQAAPVAIWAALLAHKTGCPVKFRLTRDEDQKITGKRHPFKSQYKIGFDNDGHILAYHVQFHANAGYSTDLSMAILSRARCHAENSYFIPNIRIESTAWKTNLPSNTAFRGFGAPQGIFVIESAIENMAGYLQKDAADIRFKNFYQNQSNNITPYGQLVENNQLENIRMQLLESSGYYPRLKAIDHFNRESKTLKRGIALVPVKFGISFNTPFLNQAGALVNIYTDGSILVNHGGIEMGQGLYTKIKQIATSEFGIDESKIRINATNTAKVPNTSATAASTGSDMNGMAVKNAIDQIKKRMHIFLETYWQISTQPFTLVFDKGMVYNQINPNQTIQFNDLINLLYLNRISLSAQGYYATPNVYFDKETQQGKPFHYFVFGMSVSEVEVNLLTGHHTIIRTDILHDCGNSINPEIDKGQIEGAFVQGVGWCTMEECKWNDKGKLLNSSPDTYKIPAINDIPKQWFVELLQDAPNSNTIMNSKAVGEPPFIHGLSVFFAIRNSIKSISGNQVIILDLPATQEKIALEVKRLAKNKYS